MNKLLIAAAALSLVAPSLASAQPSDHQRDGGQNAQQQHAGWGREYGGGHNFHRGERIGYNDWSGAQPIDYREHHLRRPPHGYEWRESNGQFILGALAGGLIASAVISR